MRVAAVPTESGMPLAAPSGQGPADQLRACAEQHGTALSVRAVDVVEEMIGLRCAECRRIYQLHVPAIETHQR